MSMSLCCSRLLPRQPKEAQVLPGLASVWWHYCNKNSDFWVRGSVSSWQSWQFWYCARAGLYKPILAVGRAVLCTCEEPVHISLIQGQGVQCSEGLSRQNIPGPCTRVYSIATEGSSAASFRMILKADVGVMGRSQMQHRQLLDSFFQIPMLTTLSQTGLLVPSPPLPTSVLILCTSSPF